MKYKLLSSLMFLGLCQTSLQAGDFDFLSVNVYGTLGAAFQDNKNVLHRDSFYAKGVRARGQPGRRPGGVGFEL